MGRYTAKCHGPNCNRVGDCARGFCGSCYNAFRAACKLNGSWGRRDADDLPPPVIPKWTYENPAGEAELAAQAEKLEAQNNE
jgi:hypothetical protein